MGKTKIGWADYTWNVLAGCSKTSEGCRFCWAERMAFRTRCRGHPDYQGVVDDEGHWTGQVNCLDHRLEQPLHWRKPRRIFVASMADLFHPNVPFDFIAQVFEIMASPRTEQHTFILLTKRAARMRHFYNWLRARFETGAYWAGDSALGLALEERWPLPNVWVGVSCENQATVHERIPVLLRTPAAVRWVSLEPLLESIHLRPYLPHNPPLFSERYGHKHYLDWVVIGAESGPTRRRFEQQWAWHLHKQCQIDDVPCFLKQGSGPRPGVPLLDRDGREVKEFPHVERST